VDEACNSVVRVRDRVLPNAANAAVMHDSYARYRRMYDGMKFIFGS